jgi:parallel beta-helix repeat protein
VNADDIVIRGNYIHDTATTGLYIKGGVENGLIENNYIRNTGTGGAQGFSFGDPPNSGAGIMLGYGTDSDFFDNDNPQFYQTMNSVVRNNIIENTGDGGILVWGSLNPQVYNNTLQNVSTHPWYFGGGIMVAGINTWTEGGDVFTKSVNPFVMNNIITVAPPAAGSPGYVTNAALVVMKGGVTGPLQLDHNLVNGLGNHGGKLFDFGNGGNHAGAMEGPDRSGPALRRGRAPA